MNNFFYVMPCLREKRPPERAGVRWHSFLCGKVHLSHRDGNENSRVFQISALPFFRVFLLFYQIRSPWCGPICANYLTAKPYLIKSTMLRCYHLHYDDKDIYILYTECGCGVKTDGFVFGISHGVRPFVLQKLSLGYQM